MKEREREGEKKKEESSSSDTIDLPLTLSPLAHLRPPVITSLTVCKSPADVDILCNYLSEKDDTFTSVKRTKNGNILIKL